MNNKLIKPLIFLFTAVLHVVIILFMVFDTEKKISEEFENARVMKLTDLDEAPPPPPPPEEEVIPQVEAIAETMIETDIPPVQTVVAAGTLTTPSTVTVATIEPLEEEYFPMHRLSSPPQFDANAIAADLIYPPIALRSGIEGRVNLELFVDRTGAVQRIIILREEPEGRGFGEAAVRAFTGKKGTPATANDEPVSARFRYPVTFRIR